jgi:excisionase family DNA binding protein
MTPRLAYPLAEAARLSSLSVRSLRYLMQQGKLGFAKVGRRVLIPHADLERLLKRAYVKPSTVLDADEPIRPRTEKRNAPSGKLEALGGGPAEQPDPGALNGRIHSITDDA